MGARPHVAGAALTALLHLWLVFALQVAVTVVEPPLPPHEPTADALHEAGDQVVEVDIHPGLATPGLPCEGSSYVGVGITAEPATERIILVGDNTPASRAGLQHGDVVLNPSVWREARLEGSWLRLRLLRRGVQLEAWVQVGKICIG